MSALTCVGRISAIRAVHFAGAIGMGMSTRCCVGEEGEEAEGGGEEGRHGGEEGRQGREEARQGQGLGQQEGRQKGPEEGQGAQEEGSPV